MIFALIKQRLTMATALDVSELALNSLLCFCISKHGKLSSRSVKQTVLDYYQAEDISLFKKKLLSDTESV